MNKTIELAFEAVESALNVERGTITTSSRSRLNYPRMIFVIMLREMGASYKAIGEVLCCSYVCAFKYYHRSLHVLSESPNMRAKYEEVSKQYEALKSLRIATH